MKTLGNPVCAQSCHENPPQPSYLILSGVWNIIFNLTVPGWLPASSVIGFDELGVRYGLHATAKFLDLETSRSPWALATFCAPFLSKAKTAQAQRTVQVRRFLAPPSPDPPVFNTVNYLVNNPAISAKEDNIKKRIPLEVLAKIQTILSAPEYVDVNEKKMDVTLRLKSDGLEQEECERFQLVDISLSLVQTEKCRYAYIALSLKSITDIGRKGAGRQQIIKTDTLYHQQIDNRQTNHS